MKVWSRLFPSKFFLNGNKRDSFKSKANIKRIRSHSKYYYTVERGTGEWTALGEFLLAGIINLMVRLAKV